VVTANAHDRLAGGPYRERDAAAPDSVDAFWRQNRRDRAIRRALQVCVVVAALAPAAAIAIGGAAMGRTEPRPPSTPESQYGPTPGELSVAWGLDVSPSAVREWSGRLPASAVPPSAAESPVPFDQLRDRLLILSPSFSACYARELERKPTLTGTLVVSLLVRRDGTVTAGAGELTPERASGLSSCVEHAFEFQQFPAPGSRYGVIHVPLRFATHQ
jgi:hypothetical protein